MSLKWKTDTQCMTVTITPDEAWEIEGLLRKGMRTLANVPKLCRHVIKASPRLTCKLPHGHTGEHAGLVQSVAQNLTGGTHANVAKAKDNLSNIPQL